MTIHFFEIQNCTLLYNMGYPIFLAPDCADEELLAMRGFAKQNDGKWIRYVNQFEYGYIMQLRNSEEIIFNDETVKNISYSPIPYPTQFYGASPQENSNTATILCIISICLMLITVPILFTKAALFSGLSFIAAMVLMIIARVMYPKSTFAKILCIIYIFLAVILLVISIAAIITLYIACNECVNSLSSCS
ncbi:MAG: hypothetical protein K5898_10855 [Ruminococcus sp.]|uniref:hypothetical protein n=1 Tax=Ruminococcus sp. TaxID=41978 RepID=UPI0025F1740A|nr:hypothetical protein [Ruminococcus sp.]MCR4795640.1 hypothetical protein [Ruminococcus sp.]